MDGSATFTTVLSSDVINVARLTATSVHQRLRGAIGRALRDMIPASFV
jgi:hypothetical protein